LIAALAESERDLLRERVRSGIAAARKRGVVFGRRPGQRVKADRFALMVPKLVR
jgi:putative DNA-invertase from lambdoid prophage Rac